jgi:hypothetical protein
VTRFSGSCDASKARNNTSKSRVRGIEHGAEQTGISDADPLKRVTTSEQCPARSQKTPAGVLTQPVTVYFNTSNTTCDGYLALRYTCWVAF